MKKKILIFVDWYLPGYKAGGPIKSIATLVSHFHNQFDFYIVTTNKDYGSKGTYPETFCNRWMPYNDGTHRYYLSEKDLSPRKLLEITKSHPFHKIYLNSYFSLYFSIIPLLFKKLFLVKTPIILAPRGMLGTGALQIKKNKKTFFILISKLIGLHKNILWHATSEEECTEIKKLYGNNTKTITASNLQYKEDTHTNKNITAKEKNDLKLFFVSRITEKKNLLFAIDTLTKINNPTVKINFLIIGPVESQPYWNTCMEKAKALTKNITINYSPPVPNYEIETLTRSSHFLFLPTQNENYGHVIVESLINGKPVIISDQTPWRNLQQKNIGWDISLTNQNKFIETINYCINIEQQEYNKMCTASFQFANKHINNPEIIKQNLQLFT